MSSPSNLFPTANIFAFSILGFVVGIIYVSDAWNAPTDNSNNPIHKSPKIRGLVYVTGAGLIPGLKDLSKFFPNGSQTPESGSSTGLSIVAYTIAFGITVVLGLSILAWYAFLVSRAHISQSQPNIPSKRVSIMALPYVSTALRRGDYAFTEGLREISALSVTLTQQRDDSVEFLTGVFTALVSGNINQVSGTQEFINFTEKNLQIFIQTFLEPSRQLDKYRACIYYLDRSNDIDRYNGHLLFLAGVSPFDSKHSRDSLSLDESFAGWVIQRPGKVHTYNHGGRQSRGQQELPFEDKKNRVRYESVVSCAVQPLKKIGESHPPIMVLCLDCSESEDNIFKRYDGRSFIEKMVLFLSVIVATAQASMGVSSTDINEWIRQSSSSNGN